MKYAIRSLLSLILLGSTSFAYDDPPTGSPQAETLEPKIGKAGTILKVRGRALSKPGVDEVYLTDHRFDLKVKVLEQTDSDLTLRVPPFVKPGKLQLLFLTGGKNPVFLEQPLYVQIEEGEDLAPAPVEVTKSKAKTVEIASSGKSIPVPPAPTPAPMTSRPVDRQQVAAKVAPLQQQPPVEVAKNDAPKPVTLAAPPATPVAAPPSTPNPTESQVQQSTAPGATNNPPPVHVTPHADTATVVPPQVIRRSRVSYPAAAQNTKAEGIVELVAMIRADGRVKDVKVVKGNPYLVPAAVSSVRDWLYEPARLNGKAVESDVVILLNFKRP